MLYLHYLNALSLSSLQPTPLQQQMFFLTSFFFLSPFFFSSFLVSSFAPNAGGVSFSIFFFLLLPFLPAALPLCLR
jgi:hypothetical protein